MKPKGICLHSIEVRTLLADGQVAIERPTGHDPGFLAYAKEQFVRDGMWYPTTPSGKVGLAEPLKCPHGGIGQTLWIKETFSHIWTDRNRGWHYVYRADGIPDYLPKGEVILWRPSTNMKREQSRLQAELRSLSVTLFGEVWQWRLEMVRKDKAE